jgi:biopolymer transport protein ExbD
VKNPRIQELIDETMELQIAPLIDCVFQLLIYFMVAASLHKTEADLGISLPGSIVQAQTITMPDEQIIEIDAAGRVLLNNAAYGKTDPSGLPDLVAVLVRYRQAAEGAKTKALITIMAADEVPHQRVIDVLNACAGAGIKNVTFGMSGG